MNAHRQEVISLLNRRSGLPFSADYEVKVDWSDFIYLLDAAGHVAAVAKVREVMWYETEVTRLCVREDCQGKGWGKRLLLAAERHAREDSHPVLQLTITESNFGAKCLAYSCGFKLTTTFYNRFSGHRVGVWHKNIQEEA